MFILLSGSAPFEDDDQFKLFQKIKKCEYEFDEEDWSTVSKEARDFITRIFVPEPAKRMTMEEMFDHPWFQMEFQEGD